MNSDTNYETPFGVFVLNRSNDLSRGPVGQDAMRAWDGADLLLLETLHTLIESAGNSAPGPGVRIAVFGDTFGALTVALHQFKLAVVSYSIVASDAIRRNAATNEHATPSVFSGLTGTSLAAEMGGPVDFVVWHVSKSTSETSHVTSLLSQISHSGTVVFAAGMDKHLPPKTADILRSVGAVTTHPGRRKAHLFELRPHHEVSTIGTLIIEEPKSVKVPEYELSLYPGPGVFSSDRFDLGTRLLAQHISALDIDPDAKQVVDLGCGTGALGMLALRVLPEATVHFVDESAQAVAASLRNVTMNASTLGNNAVDRSRFVQSNVFAHTDLPPIDLIVCNPPFHHANAMNDEVAWEMFQQSFTALNPGGELWVVANRHLGYHAKLDRIFPEVGQISAHPKFVVLAARK
jgi:23S rRNA (guanine1835-N2)-methyltransferase